MTREELLKKARGERPEFTICRRLAHTELDAIGEHDRRDACAQCQATVVYDARHAGGAGTPHVCIACAARLAEAGNPSLAALRAERVTDAEAGDKAQYARLRRAVDGNRAGNNRLPRFGS